MFVLGIFVALALLIPLVTLGSYKHLINTDMRWGWLLGTGLAVQLGLEYYTLPVRYWHSVGFGLLVASYVLILGFVARNVVLRGMSIVFIGVFCNALVITLNQGMPVKLPPEWRNQPWAQATVKHHPEQPGEQLRFLSDIIIVKGPLETVMSFGDLILAVGLCDVAFNASRDPRRRKKKAQLAVARPSAQPYPAEHPGSPQPTGVST